METAIPAVGVEGFCSLTRGIAAGVTASAQILPSPFTTNSVPAGRVLSHQKGGGNPMDQSLAERLPAYPISGE